MPRSIITRLAKGVLPPNTQIQGSAITGMSKSATVFISHLANAYVYRQLTFTQPPPTSQDTRTNSAVLIP